MTPEFDLFASLPSSFTILTPNRRLAATLHKKYHRYQQELEHTCWQTPDILPLASWCERIWREHTCNVFSDHLFLLSAVQEQFIWEKIISESKDSLQLLQVTETADIARSAWALLNQWQLDLDDPLFQATEDSSALFRWLTIFKTLCTQKSWLDLPSLMSTVTQLIASKNIALPEKIVCVGFTEINPQMQLLLDSIKANTAIEAINLQHKNPRAARLSFIDSEGEIFALAQWAKHQLTKNPHSNIGCVIPALDKVRDRVAQIFNEVFADSNATQTQPYNISAGKSLSEYPIIHTAFQLLNLHRSLIYTDTFSHILLSPFIGNAEAERIQRAKYDVLLRKYNINRIDLAVQLQSSDSTYNLKQHIPLLAGRLQTFFDYLHNLDTYASYSQWSQIFNHLLSLLGWPGERSINSEEYQTVEQWLKLLKQYISLEQINDNITLSQALSDLQKLARRQIFQPKSPDAPIQVLGLLEAAGLTFDCLWVGGMDDVAWPPQPKPNPLLPKRLQRERLMPHASAQRELNFSKLLTEQFLQSAGQVYFSHAMHADDFELQASPLVLDLPEIAYQRLVPKQTTSFAERIFSSKSITHMLDENGPEPFSANVRGGVNVIKQQALCPFKAFSEWRLFAREIEKPMPGLRSKDRGTILHKVLEILWGTLQSHANLIALSNQALTDLINTSTNMALDRFPLPRSNSSTYLHLEKLRIHKLVSEWLELEKTRAPFTVIAYEQQMQITINQLQLNVKIDRIDQLEDGKKLIIDYKTGSNNSISGWLTERPEEPQLPLYALHDPAQVAGITFAQIVPGEHKFIGVSQYDLAIPGIKTITEIKQLNISSWEDQLKHWETIFSRLSDDFFHGLAHVDPKDSQQTCLWCQLKSFCRINEEVIVPNAR